MDDHVQASLDDIDRELLGESGSSDERDMSADENRHIAPGGDDNDNDEEDSELSDSRSIATDDAFGEDNDFADLSRVAVDSSEDEPDLTREQIIEYINRRRRPLRRRRAAQSAASSSFVAVAQPPAPVAQPSAPIAQAPAPVSQPPTTPESTPQPPQPSQPSSQSSVIVAESGPGHRTDYSDSQQDQQTNSDREFAAKEAGWKAEKESWAAEKARTEQSAAAQIQQLTEQLQIRDQKLGEQGQTIASHAGKIDQLGREWTAQENEFHRQLAAKDDELTRIREEAMTIGENVVQQFAAKDAIADDLRGQLAAEQQNHRDAMDAAAAAHDKQEKRSAHNHRKEMRELRQTLRRENRSRSRGRSGARVDIGGLIGDLSKFSFQRESNDRAPGPAIVTEPEQQPGDSAPGPAIATDPAQQPFPADEYQRGKRRGAKRVRAKAHHQALRPSLARCEVKLRKQPSVGDWTARLENLQAHLDQERTKALQQQHVRLQDEFSKALDASSVEQEAALAAKDDERARVMAELQTERTQALQQQRARLQDGLGKALDASSLAQEVALLAKDDEWARVTAKMQTEWKKVDRQLAFSETKMRKQAEEIHELEERRRREAAAPPPPSELAVEKMGEKEMDALLGVPEKATEGLLRPLFLSWREFLFWLLVSFVFAGGVAAFSAASSASQQRQILHEMTQHAMKSQHVNDDPVMLGRDFFPAISMGMYAVF